MFRKQQPEDYTFPVWRNLVKNEVGFTVERIHYWVVKVVRVGTKNRVLRNQVSVTKASTSNPSPIQQPYGKGEKKIQINVVLRTASTAAVVQNKEVVRTSVPDPASRINS